VSPPLPPPPDARGESFLGLGLEISPPPAPPPPPPAVIVPPGKDATVLVPAFPGVAGVVGGFGCILSLIRTPPAPIEIGQGPDEIVCPVALTNPPAPPPPPVLDPPDPPPPITRYSTLLIGAGATKVPEVKKV
jgi:hypothetical protein